MTLREYADLQKTILTDAAAEFTACADAIHGFAELSGEEARSSAALADLLERHGFTVERGLPGQPTAFRAVYGTGPVRIGFLAEYDALAGLQQDDVPYQQGNGAPGHGCGHNLLGVGSAAAAIALARCVDGGLGAAAIVYGCPAEETLQGKTLMVENGCFRELDAALTWHPLDHNDPGDIRFKAVSAFTMTFRGRAAHACNCPQNGRSALDAAELTNIGVNYLREHVARDCYMHYSYLHGGDRPNIVPETAKLWYMVRADRFDDMRALRARVEQVARGACLMTDTTVAFETIGENHDSKLNHTLCALAHDCLRAVPVPEFSAGDRAFAQAAARAVNLPEATGELRTDILPISGAPRQDNGSSDVADVSQVVPTVNINTTCYGACTPNHTWAVTAQARRPAAHKGMLYAARVLGLMALRLVLEPDLLDRVKKEFEQGT